VSPTCDSFELFDFWSAAADPGIPAQSYSPLDETSYDYFSLARNQTSLQVGDDDTALRTSGIGPPLTSMGYHSARGSVSPGVWSEANSQAYDRDIFPSVVEGGDSGFGGRFSQYPFAPAVLESSPPRALKRPSTGTSSQSTDASWRTRSSHGAFDHTTNADTKPPKSSKKSKSVKPSPPASITSSGGGNHNIRLRTASRKPKVSRKASKASSSSTLAEDSVEAEVSLRPEEVRARQTHNLVEKQYRSRLNAQFEQLLAILPAGQHGVHDPDRADGEVEEKRMSKAEVLDVATRRIKTLEQETYRLQQERRDLLHNAELMNNAVERQRFGQGPTS
jgi:Helix-loop-helix DNA-binding domain